MKSVYVVSDLHMFCKRSQWERHVEAMHDAASRAEVFIFNGDTVDFKWSSLPSLEQTVEEAVAFLRDFTGQYPSCQFHVNLGNHDHVPRFMEALDCLAMETHNLTWHPYYLRINRTLFLHGDVANRRMSHAELEQYRAGWGHRRNQGRVQNRVYDAAFKAKAHLAVARLAFPRRRTLRRVSAYLDDIGHGLAHGVDRVYFGHTHVPVPGHLYGGVMYHNGGAPMEGMGFRLLKALV